MQDKEVNRFCPECYGDLWGVAFHIGNNSDPLEISSTYFDGLMYASLERVRRGDNYEDLPKIIREWNECFGWVDASQKTLLLKDDVESFVDAMESLNKEDFITEECIRNYSEYRECIEHLCSFLKDAICSGKEIYIENL